MDSPAHLLTQGRDWLDDRGKIAWIAAMILGFVFFWPVGLFFLFYMIGTNRMGPCRKHRGEGRFHRMHRRHGMGSRYNSSGNTAFDAYREETLKRLEDEQSAFQTFLGNLRAAKDRAEFEDFMKEHKDSGTGDQAPA